ncbi:MAG: STAS domain-containing protein, partial [Rhodocyclaceae bacterium]|nr:STAS domain-containing protein [Rhodocyclaceae bacterium]
MTDAVLPLTGELTLAHAAAQLAAGQRFLATASAGGAVTFDLRQIDRADTSALALACQWSRQAAA